MNKGIFIVIDGTDGSGKATQTKLLVDRLRAEGQPVETISFPQYGKKSAAMVEEYLSGKYGTVQEVGPKPASIFYAIDRFDAAPTIRQWLADGKIVVADRYVGSNLGHHGAKISDPAERMKFYQWDLDLEHNLFGVPEPDINIVLIMPPETAQRLAQERGGWKADIKTDIHETDLNHLRAASEAYLDLTRHFPTFKRVDCVEGDTLLSREIIHERIRTLIKPLIKPLITSSSL